MNDCGSSRCTRTSTFPESAALFSRVPACGNSATVVWGRRVQAGSAGV